MDVDQAIDITAAERSTVFALLERHLPGTAWVYGSRARGPPPRAPISTDAGAAAAGRRPAGGLRGKQPPVPVDLFVWDEVPESFKAHIEAQHRDHDSTARP